MATLKMIYNNRYPHGDTNHEVKVEPENLLTNKQKGQIAKLPEMVAVNQLNDWGWETVSGPQYRDEGTVWSFIRKELTPNQPSQGNVRFGFSSHLG